MKKRKLLAAVMAMTIAGTTLLSGCGMNTGATLVNINNGEDSISLGYGNFVARYTQSLYDATYMQYMGTSMWTKEQDGTTFQDSVKKLVMKSLKESGQVMREEATEEQLFSLGMIGEAATE